MPFKRNEPKILSIDSREWHMALKMICGWDNYQRGGDLEDKSAMGCQTDDFTTKYFIQYTLVPMGQRTA